MIANRGTFHLQRAFPAGTRTEQQDGFELAKSRTSKCRRGGPAGAPYGPSLWDLGSFVRFHRLPGEGASRRPALGRIEPRVAPHTTCAPIIIAVRATGWRVAGAMSPAAGTQPR
jgi:hypothetical protein